jgi:TorA maturation chaperone TorD
MSQICSERVVDPIDGARAREYALLATLLAKSPDTQLIRQLASLDCDESPLGIAHALLANAAAQTSESSAAREYLELFIGLERGLLPYASYYLTGSLCGPPLARVRQSFQRLGIEAALPWEPEDHIVILFEVMAGLVSGDIAGPRGADREFFGRQLAPWARRFCVDLENAKSARFYACVGSLGRVFMDIEADAYSHAS